METLKNISLYLVIAAIFLFFHKLIESEYVFNYLKNNTIQLQITILAINTAIYSFLIVELSRLANGNTPNFSSTIKELKISLWEQIILIILSFIILSLIHSSVYFAYSDYIYEFLLIFIILFTIDILRDLSFSIFELYK
jgi:hypothetical protein